MSKVKKEDITRLKKILEEQKAIIPPKNGLEKLQLGFRNILKRFHDLSKMVGVFSPFEPIISTTDKGGIKGGNLIKKLSKDLAEESLTVLTCYHIRTSRGGASNIHTVRLFNQLKESDSQIMDFSECLSAIVPNSIFIWNDSKTSTVLHESRSYHKNHFGDNILSFNVIFSADEPTCPSMEHIYENVLMCRNTKWENCKNKQCPFTKEISAGNREPLVKKHNSILVVSKTYKDIVPLFKHYFKKFWIKQKSQKKLTKKR